MPEDYPTPAADPIRAALERLINDLDNYGSRWGGFPESTLDAARAALAQPAPPAEALAARPLLERVARMGDCIGATTVGEITSISARAAAWLRQNPPGQPVAIEPRGCPTPGACSCVEPTPPAEGDVGELVADELVRQLRTKAATEKANRCHYSAILLTRAADLLAQRHPAPVAVAAGEDREFITQLRSYAEYGTPIRLIPFVVKRAADLLEQRHPAPVAVSERLPGPGDCDAEGRCWLLTVEDEYPQWRLHSIEGHQPGGRMIWIPVDRTPGVMVDAFYASHWLPAHAIPLPAPQGGEDQP